MKTENSTSDLAQTYSSRGLGLFAVLSKFESRPSLGFEGFVSVGFGLVSFGMGLCVDVGVGVIDFSPRHGEKGGRGGRSQWLLVYSSRFPRFLCSCQNKQTGGPTAKLSPNVLSPNADYKRYVRWRQGENMRDNAIPQSLI